MNLFSLTDGSRRLWAHVHRLMGLRAHHGAASLVKHRLIFMGSLPYLTIGKVCL